MCALEGKIRQLMIEGVTVELHDISVPSFMIGMALFAFLITQTGDASVISLFIA